MESTELIRAGLDAVEQMVAYLAKDALGSEFLGEYARARDRQAEARERQKEALDVLKASSDKMESDVHALSESADDNSKRIQKLFDAIVTLRDSVDKIEQEHRIFAERFRLLRDETKGIARLIEEIQNISEQTSLLSFNASIEAAHAGSAGAGFRIIANEVKKLSDNTKKTTGKIRQTVDSLTESIDELENGTKANAKKLRSLTEETGGTLARFEKMRRLNDESNLNVEKFGESIEENVSRINSMIRDITSAEDVGESAARRFAECASRNQLLFCDLYSLTYEVKAALEDLRDAR